MPKDPHLPIWISGLYPIIREYLLEFKSVFRQRNIVGLRIPFFETSKLVTIAELPMCVSSYTGKTVHTAV